MNCCNVCRKNYSTKYSLKRHQKTTKIHKNKSISCIQSYFRTVNSQKVVKTPHLDVSEQGLYLPTEILFMIGKYNPILGITNTLFYNEFENTLNEKQEEYGWEQDEYDYMTELVQGCLYNVIEELFNEDLIPQSIFEIFDNDEDFIITFTNDILYDVRDEIIDIIEPIPPFVNVEYEIYKREYFNQVVQLIDF